MPGKRSRASNSSSLPATDDFKLIKGVGPAVDRRLHKAGIRTFAQLAALSAEQIAAQTGLSAARITHENWIGQASRLARPSNHKPASHKAAKEKPRKIRPSATPGLGRQHYATFTVELLLDETDNVRRTRYAHIQSRDQETWAGWDETRLMEFIVRHAGLGLTSVSSLVSSAQSEATLPTTPMAEPSLEPPPESGRAAVETRESLPLPAEAATVSDSGVDPAAGPSRGQTASISPAEAESIHRAAAVRVGLGGILRLSGLTVMPMDTDSPSRVLPTDALFRVRLTVDPTELTELPDVPLDLIINIYAKRFGGGPHQHIGQARAATRPADTITIQVECVGLSPGDYRLEAEANMTLPSTGDQALHVIPATLKGSLLHIY